MRAKWLTVTIPTAHAHPLHNSMLQADLVLGSGHTPGAAVMAGAARMAVEQTTTLSPHLIAAAQAATTLAATTLVGGNISVGAALVSDGSGRRRGPGCN